MLHNASLYQLISQDLEKTTETPPSGTKQSKIQCLGACPLRAAVLCACIFLCLGMSLMMNKIDDVISHLSLQFFFRGGGHVRAIRTLLHFVQLWSSRERFLWRKSLFCLLHLLCGLGSVLHVLLGRCGTGTLLLHRWPEDSLSRSSVKMQVWIRRFLGFPPSSSSAFLSSAQTCNGVDGTLHLTAAMVSVRAHPSPAHS